MVRVNVRLIIKKYGRHMVKDMTVLVKENGCWLKKISAMRLNKMAATYLQKL